MILIAFLGLAGAGGFGWLQYQALAGKHNSLQERFNNLESRLSSTDESVTQSGAAMQLNISKQGDELKKHWSEIRKLWGVTNDINKGKIEKNKKDIVIFGQQAQRPGKSMRSPESIKSLAADQSKWQLSGVFADMDAVNDKSAQPADQSQPPAVITADHGSQLKTMPKQ